MKHFPIKELLSVILYPTIFLIVCWVLFLLDTYAHLDLYRLGVEPRRINGLKGILFSPFIHGDFNHILNNSLPVFFLSVMIFYFYKSIAWSTIFWIYAISGIWLWVGGRNSDVVPTYHFGASILIYGFSTFLFFSGVFRKHKQLMVVSAIVVFMYGSITWGIFPLDRTISWEGHLFGAISGVLVAYNYRKEGPQAQEYQWSSLEDDTDLPYNESEEIILDIHTSEKESQEKPIEKPSLDPFQIVYHYKKDES